MLRIATEELSMVSPELAYLNGVVLEAVSERVKAGMPVEFPSEMLQSRCVSKEQLDAEVKRLGRRCVIGLVALLVLMSVAFVVLRIWR